MGVLGWVSEGVLVCVAVYSPESVACYRNKTLRAVAAPHRVWPAALVYAMAVAEVAASYALELTCSELPHGMISGLLQELSDLQGKVPCDMLLQPKPTNCGCFALKTQVS